MKFMLISPKNRTVYNFRGDLVKEIQKKGYDVIVTGPNEDNIEKIKELGVEFRKIDLDKNSMGIFNNVKYYLELKKLFKEEKPDVILSYTIKPVIFGSLAAKKAGVKRIYSLITGLGQIYATNDLKTKIIRFICGIAYKKIFKYNEKVIFQNIDDLNECVDRKYLQKEKCEVVDGSGVNMNRFKKTELPKENTFLMVSRMLKTKGVQEYLDAAKIVKAKYPETTFLYVGSTENMNSYVRKEELKEYIDNKIINYCEQTEDVPSVIMKSTVFVLPSYYREGIPRTLLEALAMARPIITTDSIGCRETVKDGKNGFLIPIKNSKVLAEKMIYMIEHRGELEEMAEESYKYCKERFDVNIINKKMLDIMKI